MVGRSDSQRLVGRDAALAALRSAADTRAGGRGRLLLVTGEPGIGKTALLTAMSGEAAAGGALVLSAQCWDGDGAPAYWPWVQVLRAGMAAGGEPVDAAMLLPESASSSPPGGDSADARFRLFDALVTFLAGLAEQRPVLVIIDDLQWADEGSLRLLEFAARHLGAREVFLLGAYRDEQAGESLRRLAGTSERVPLLGLARAEVATLMSGVTGAQPTEQAATDVWRRTGGNPFLVRELTRLLIAQGGYGAAGSATQGLLDSVRDILERRLARLSQPCAELLAVAAIAGQQVRLEVLDRLYGDTEDLAALLDEAVAARVLLEPAARVGPYRFSHDLFRETLLAGLTAGRRVELHLAVGRTLEALRDEGTPVHAAELAAHFDAAVTAAPADAVRYGMLAGEDAGARLAFEDACGHYARALAALDLAALDLAPDSAPATRLELTLRLADAHARAGHAPADRDGYRDAAEQARALGDAAGTARSAIGMHSLGWRESHAESIALLEEAVQALPATPTALRARVLAALARDLHHAWEYQNSDRAPVLAEEAVANAREAGDPSTRAFCLLALHDARWRIGTADVRLPVIKEMLTAATEAGEGELVAQARLLLATALIEIGDPDGTAELEGYCRLSEELRHARAKYGACTRRATTALLAGNLASAEDLAKQGLELGRKIGEPDAVGVYETLMWGVNRAAGTWHQFAELSSNPWPDLPLADAVQEVASGDLDAARRTLSRIRLDSMRYTHDLEMLTFLAEVVAAAGTDEQRALLYERLLAYSGMHIVVGGCASYFGAVDLYLGMLARSLGRVTDARGHFDAATALHERLGAVAWVERSRKQTVECRPEAKAAECVFRREGDTWTVVFHGAEAHLPDVKGLRDLVVLLERPGEAVHAVELHTGRPPQTGADDVLDDRAKAAYRGRLTQLDADIDEAEADNDTHRAEKARAERDALIAELSAAIGLGGRDRRLGDERERARKAVTARIRDAIGRIERAIPELAEHLRGSVQTGTWCTYAPPEPLRWRR